MQRDTPFAEVDIQWSTSKEIQSQETVDTRARGHSMTQDLEFGIFPSQSAQPACRDARNEFYPAACRDLHAIQRERWIVTYRHERPDVYHRASRARVQRKT
jgi:hypothetical protein